MINDVTYELIRIVKKIDLNNSLLGRIEESNISKIVSKDIENVIKEMVETDSQFRFKKSIFDRQYGMNVKYLRCGEVVIKPKEGLGLATIMEIDEFLKVLSFKIYKGIEKAKEENKNWELWQLSKVNGNYVRIIWKSLEN